MGRVACKDLGACGKIFAILTIIFAVFVAVLTIPYWYYVNQIATTPNALDDTANQAALAIQVVSAAILIAVCICGVLGAALRHVKLLLIFVLVNVSMFIFVMLQIILTYVTFLDCSEPLASGDRLPNSPFEFICTQTDDFWYWVPLLINLYINLCAAAFGGLTRWRIMLRQSKGGDFY
eukprot:TRINITY_DN14961_c0_g1_i1.p1 TRINITY_DN14961_c0_g1~~TRINITY_DN14961_c0_g1_i1.p1  ORF type:complete len:198 (+),score=23.15 TRINITY_DN14961_c0_g1_i1:62-595(+)